MSDAASPSPDFEGLLRRALAPVEPPEDFALRIEQTLQTITDLAAEELEAWEAGAMVDPRNWPTIARPVAAVAFAQARSRSVPSSTSRAPLARMVSACTGSMVRPTSSRSRSWRGVTSLTWLPAARLASSSSSEAMPSSAVTA